MTRPLLPKRESARTASTVTFLVCCVLSLAAYGQPPMRLAHADPLVPSSYARPPGATRSSLGHPLPRPALTAVSAILIDAATGEVLFEQNADEVRAPASTTKIMTAILALELGHPEGQVLVSEQATLTGGSRLLVSANEVLPLRQVIEATMVKSGNDGAAALAETIGGSEPRFLGLMNEKARALGMLNTFFQNPHGMPMVGGGNRSTAREMATLSRYAMQNPDFRAIVMEPLVHYSQFGIRADVEFKNTNHLLTEFPLCTGIKTGFTNEARHCLAAAARFKDREVIGVIFGGEKGVIRAEMVSLFDYGLNQLDSEYWVYRKFSLEPTPYPFDVATPSMPSL